MPNEPPQSYNDRPVYAARFAWQAPLPTPQTWKQDAKRISSVLSSRYHDALNDVRDNDRTWTTLTTTERQLAWATRGQTAITDDLTHWEQRAAIHEAFHRAEMHNTPPTYPHHVAWGYVEVEHVPARFQTYQGGPYAYTVWSREYLGNAGGDTMWPHPPGTARDVDAVVEVVAHARRGGPSFPVEVYTEDVALRRELRERGVPLGQRFSPVLAQERREFYTLEAQQAVREARSTRDWHEADWHDLTARQQQAAYARAGQGDTATLWEQRLAAQLKLARREQMLPYASRSGHQLPEAFVEVEAKAGREAPYRVTRWTRVWDTDLGITRYAHDPPQRVPTLEAVAEAAQNGKLPIFADTLGMRAQLRQHGLTVVAQEHMAMQRPVVERSQERDRGHGLGE